ncbi:MAG: type II toxin-antitoxin system HicB family antitoxin [Microcystis sp.]
MQNPINLTIECLQENGQDYYVATSPDIQGLVAEADTIDAVIDIAKDLIPILLELETEDQPSSSVTLTTANQFHIPLLIS